MRGCISSNQSGQSAGAAFVLHAAAQASAGRAHYRCQAKKDSERIIEISLETLNELGFTVSKKLIFEIMGKHSNIVLVDLASGKIIDAIKRVSFDVNRVRQILPGLAYQYPPAQDKTPFREITAEAVAAAAGQQSDPAEHRWYFSAFAGELALHTGADRAAYILNRSRRRLRQASLPPMFTRMTNSIR